MIAIENIIGPIISGLIGAGVSAIITLNVERNRIRAQIETERFKYQYKLYTEVWVSLYDLKKIADNLWENPEVTLLYLFANKLQESQDMINRNDLLLETFLIEKLNILFSKFWEFRLGKAKLINIYQKENSNSYENIRTISDKDVEWIINDNKELKNDYDVLIKEIKQSVQSKLNN